MQLAIFKKNIAVIYNLLKDINSNHDWYPKQMCNLDLLPEIATAAASNQAQVLEMAEKEEREQR